MNIFVTGTDTDVGKTFVSAALAALMQSLGYKTGVYKPFQSGAEEKNGFLMAPDLAYVKKIDAFVDTACTYLMKPATAPSLAAEIDKISIDMSVIARDYKTLNDKCELVITEGAGGLCVPVAPRLLTSDIVKFLNLPLVIVARPDLGTINHTLLTINYAKEQNINVHYGTIHSSDVFYGKEENTAERLFKEHGCVCVEMESFALFHNANTLGKKAACILTISDSLVTHKATTSEERQYAFEQMMRIALELK